MSLFFSKFAAPRKIMVIFGFLLMSLPISAASAQTQGEEQNVQVFKDWFLRCGSAEGGAERCVLFQDLIDQNTQRPLMQLAVGLWGTDLQRGIIITLPLGVILPPGIRMEIDGENIGSAPFYRCAPNGCQARIPLQEELLNRLKAGSAGNIYFREVNGQDVPIPFSLSGFTAGFASVR